VCMLMIHGVVEDPRSSFIGSRACLEGEVVL
jgi:hypothetical protein